MSKRQTVTPYTHPCPHPPRAVIFDLDGTLVDSLPCIVECFNAGLQATGHRTMSSPQIAAMLGPTLEQLYAKRVGPRQVARACERYQETFDTLFSTHIRPMTGALALLDELRAAGIPIGVCTNRLKYVDEILAQCDLLSRVDVVVQLRDAPEAPKPRPDLLYVAMDRLDAIPDETCYVGDSETDMRAGRAAHVWTIGVRTLGLDAATLEVAGAHLVADTLDVLPTVLGLREPVGTIAAGEAVPPEAEAAAEPVSEASQVEAGQGPSVSGALHTQPERMISEGAPEPPAGAEPPAPSEQAEVEADTALHPAPERLADGPAGPGRPAHATEESAGRNTEAPR